MLGRGGPTATDAGRRYRNIAEPLAKSETDDPKLTGPRTLKLELSDGARTVVAAEKEKVPDFGTPLPYGCKVLAGTRITLFSISSNHSEPRPCSVCACTTETPIER